MKSPPRSDVFMSRVPLDIKKRQDRGASRVLVGFPAQWGGSDLRNNSNNLNKQWSANSKNYQSPHLPPPSNKSPSLTVPCPQVSPSPIKGGSSSTFPNGAMMSNSLSPNSAMVSPSRIPAWNSTKPNQITSPPPSCPSRVS